MVQLKTHIFTFILNLFFFYFVRHLNKQSSCFFFYFNFFAIISCMWLTICSFVSCLSLAFFRKSLLVSRKNLQLSLCELPEAENAVLKRGILQPKTSHRQWEGNLMGFTVTKSHHYRGCIHCETLSLLWPNTDIFWVFIFNKEIFNRESYLSASWKPTCLYHVISITGLLMHGLSWWYRVDSSLWLWLKRMSVSHIPFSAITLWKSVILWTT